jgi:hypothetical protein
MEVENRYSLLNEGEEQAEVTLAIDNALAEMMKDLSDLAEGSSKERIRAIESHFYGRIHYGDEANTGDWQIDELISMTAESLEEIADEYPRCGLGDTETDECVAYRLKEIMLLDPKINKKG